MLKMIGTLSALLAIGGIFLSPATSASNPGARKCVAKAERYSLSRSDPEFDSTVTQLNGYFSSEIDIDASLERSRGYSQLVPAGAEVVTIEVDQSSCGTNRDPAPQSGVASASGCDYVGCNLPGEFDSLPPGSSVSMTSCGAGVQTGGTFIRQSNGTWVMSSYREEMATSCSTN